MEGGRGNEGFGNTKQAQPELNRSRNSRINTCLM